MMIARWQMDARFGHKDEVVASLKRWGEEIGTQIGWSPRKVRILTGSIGALEATFGCEVEIEALADLDAAWAKLAKIDAHKRWSQELEPHVVSGTMRWEVFRVV